MIWNAILFSLSLTDFRAANQIYDAGKFADAAAAYERIEPKTANVYFNLGNALFRQEKYGGAILNYERARLIAPRDPDVLANLRFAEAKAGVEDVNAPTQARQRLVRQCIESRTLPEWATMEIAALWLTLTVVGAAVWWRKWRSPLLIVATACGFLFAVTAWAVAGVLARERAAPGAVILVNRSDARFAPLTDATVHFVLSEGTKVSVLEDRGEWLLVERTDGQQGWVRRETLERIRVTSD